MSSAFGQFVGKTHVLPLRVYYEDTDLSGLVYHANYLRFMERGRSEFFRAAGIEKLASLDEPDPTAWTLRRVEIEYVRPARLDDLIEVHTRCAALTGARMSAEQSIVKGESLLVAGRVEACMITLAGKPRRIPEEIRQKLQPFVIDARPNSVKVS